MMTCPLCNSFMKLDDTDYDFRGCCDYYWICESCSSSCVEQIRFNQSFKEIWHLEKDDILKDFTLKNWINYGL